MHTSTRLLKHLAVALGFALLALVWTYPLPLQLSTGLAGHPGDNLDFLWNTWWMRQAVESSHLDFFTTDRLFAPFGVDLTLHTHTALPAWIAAVVFGRLPIISAHNVVMLISVALTGFAAYLLAWDRTRDRAAAILAGLIFGGSPYFAAHVSGHINLIAGWTIPLFLLFLLRALDRQSWTAAIAAGLCLVATAFTDYYYLVYSIVLGAAIAVTSVWSFDIRFDRIHAPRWLTATITILLIIDAAIVIAIVSSGGFVTDIAGLHITASRPTNPLAIGWGLLLLALMVRWRPTFFTESFEWRPASMLRVLLPLVVVFLIGILPLTIRAARLWQRGDYTAPTSSWRSGPGGVDLATLVLGNPWQPLSGSWTRRIYDRRNIDAVEASAWLGVVPILLAGWTLWRGRRNPEVTRWTWIGALFFVWALGPWLRVGGFDTGLLLPQNLFSFVPVLSNARMPGRATVMVVLALAMLAAYALPLFPPRRRWLIALVSGAVILADYLPAPITTTAVDVPAIYARLAELGPGTLLELPAGLRDGFGMVGRFDDRVVSYQMVHERPIVGGFAARVPMSIKRGYDETPVLRSLLRLSENGSIDARDQDLTRQEIGEALRSRNIRFVMLNRETAPPALVAYVERRMPLRPVARDGERDLFEIEQFRIQNSEF